MECEAEEGDEITKRYLIVYKDKVAAESEEEALEIASKFITDDPSSFAEFAVVEEISVINSVRFKHADIPRPIQDIINNTFHTSGIDPSVRPLSMCYEVVRKVLEFQQKEAK